MNSISIVIPAFNVASYITSTVQRLRENFEEAEIIIVVNEPVFNTAKVVKNIVDGDTRIKALYFRRRLGKGKAILEGFRIAQGEILGFIDADCPFDLSVIREKLSGLQSGGYDCIICSKWKGRTFRQVNQGLSRKLLSRLYNFIVRNWLDLNFADTQAGTKFIRKESFNKLGYNFFCAGFDFDVELLKRLLIKGARIEEIYVPHYESKRSTVNLFREIPSVIFNLYRLKRSV